MSSKKVYIGDTEVDYQQLVKFILSQKKISAIHFLKTKNKLDLRDAKEVVEAIQEGRSEEAYQLLTEHLECGNPIIEKGGVVDYSNPAHKNPFLIERKTVKGGGFILLALIMLGVGIALFMYLKSANG